MIYYVFKTKGIVVKITKAEKISDRKVATLIELGREVEPTCLNCTNDVDFEPKSRCQFTDIDNRVGSGYGWKMYCCNACKFIHLDKTSDSQKSLNSKAHSQYIILQKPNGEVVMCLGLSGSARKYGFSKTNIIQSPTGTSKGYKLIAKNISPLDYPNMIIEDHTI